MNEFEWDLLYKRKPIRNLIDKISLEWVTLLNNPSATETSCHNFIKENPSLFFWMMDETVEISEFYLNTDRKIDLVIGTSQYSYGFSYDLIELESPNANIFIKKKTEFVPSNELAVAIEQVNSWKSWINSNKASVKEILPSKKFNILDEPNFHFKIFIGKRTNDTGVLQKINEYYKNYKIEIHSYDYLTDRLNNRLFPNHYNPAHPFSTATDAQLNEYANPFRRAYSFTEWKKILRSKEFYTAHMICLNIETLLVNRAYSNSFNEFKNLFDDYKKNCA